MNRIIKNTLAILTFSERRKLFLFTLANAVISLADIVFLALLIFLVAFYTNSGYEFHIPAYINQRLPGTNSFYPVLIFLILFMFKNMVAYFAGHSQFRFIYNTAVRISHDNLLNYLDGSYAEYANVDSSVHVRKISQQPIEFCHYILTGLLLIFTELALIALSVSAILWYNSKLFLLILIILLPSVLALTYFMGKNLKAVKIHIKTMGEKTLQHLNEALSSFIESNIYGKKTFFSSRYLRYQGLLNKYLAEIRIIQGLPSRFIEVFAVSGFFILIVVHNLSGTNDAISLVTIGAFTVAIYKIIPGIAKILSLLGQIRAYEFTTHELLKDNTKNKQHDSFADTVKIVHSVRFQDVSFNYPENHTKLSSLHKVSFFIQPGDMIGITGNSGSGKTTLINLLLGFMEPTEGSILINEADNQVQQRKEFWKDIAYNRQRTFLIYDSILKNITLDDDNPVNQALLTEVINISGLNELLDKFPEGLNHIISESGKNISGGQRKRISIARALYKNAGLIILDEPFTELDESSGQSILNHLKDLSLMGKIIILITHDNKYLSGCNKIITLDVNGTKNLAHSYSRVSGK